MAKTSKKKEQANTEQANTEQANTEQAEQSNASDGLYIQLFSVHGLIRSHNLELGRDADTGGQTKYMVEFATALGERPEVRQVDLFTRRLDDDRVSDDYNQHIEPITDKARIVRLYCGGKKYKRKELLWPHTDEFIDKTLRFIRQNDLVPDLVHGHYADAGYIATELAGFLGVPLIFTGHSLGRNKIQVLQNSGLSFEEIEKQYNIEHRTAVEEEVLRKADLVIASTNHEVERGYELYDAHKTATYAVIPPGIDVDKFYPYYYDEDDAYEIDEVLMQARHKMKHEIGRFLNDPDKPFILAVSRPDRRKNISGLVTAYGEDKELQSIANLAIFAGVRKDINQMDDNEREVLTDMLLLMDKYDLYGSLALPKQHDPDTDIPVLYRLAAASRGAFVNPALVENFGITIIEASSVGLPVVTTDHGGPREIIKNCESGILVNTENTREISDALTKTLIDKETWREYSNHGINGVRRYYSWDAHAEMYMSRVGNLLEKDRAALVDETWRTTIGRQLAKVDRLIFSDIDYTLLEDKEGLEHFTRVLQEHNGDVGFGIVTGRSPESVTEVLAEHDLPIPEIVVSSVGSEIYYGHDLLPDHGYAQHISYQWKPRKIKDALASLDFLELQEDENQRRFKISYYMHEDSDDLAKVHQILSDAKLRYNLLFTHGQFLDILPHRASKGKAIKYLSYKWAIPAKQIAVAATAESDEEMLRGSFRGIVVANHEGQLGKLEGKKWVYFSEQAYANGVLEGLQHYDFL